MRVIYCFEISCFSRNKSTWFFFVHIFEARPQIHNHLEMIEQLRVRFKTTNCADNHSKILSFPAILYSKYKVKNGRNLFSFQTDIQYIFLLFAISLHLLVFFTTFFKLLYRPCHQYKLLLYDFSSRSLTIILKIIDVGFAMGKLMFRSSAFINRKISTNVHLPLIYILSRFVTLH